MGRWVSRIFAVIGFLTVLLIVLITALAFYAEGKPPAEPANVVLKLDFEQPVVEQASSSPLDFAMDETSSLPLIDILHALDDAAADPHVKGVVAYFGSEQPSLAQAQEIRAALARFRATGKFTYAYAASYGSFGMGNRAYYLASGFENIWLQPIGSVSLTGLAIQSPFFKGTLEKAGVTPDFTRREEYKSVMEMATESAFTAPVHENMQSMMSDLAEQEEAGIAESRKWDAAHVKQLMDTGPFTADEALKAGLVTRIGYADELKTELKQKAGSNYKEVGVEEYAAYSSGGTKEKPKAEVALIYGTGLITDRAVDSSVMDDEIMGADVISKAFNDAAADKKIKAIIFRIDSPGGSPQASETIRRAMISAEKAGKPVFVTMGSVAASGGYWIAMSADHIVAEPGTLTGSIGVVAGKFVVAGLMQKLGVTTDTLSTSGNAALWSMTETFTPQQRARLDAYVDDSYHAFVANVSAARKIPVDTMPSVAKGRVFTGSQASKNGLVDELGGYDVTLAAVRKKLNLTANDLMTLQQLPVPETPTEKLLSLLKKMNMDSVFFGQAAISLHNLEARINPALLDAVNAQPVMARIPSAALGLVK